MKILHIAPIGHHAEGIGTVLNKLVPLQISLGNDIRIISPFNNVTYENLTITTIADKKSFEKFIATWTPNIVVIHSVFMPIYGKFHRVLDNNKIPYLIQLHGALSQENFRKNNFKKRIALFLWISRLIKHAKSIIYLNEAEYKNSIVPKINPNYSFLPNGCDHIENINVNKTVIGDLNIIFIGRIAYTHKGIDLLLEAVRLLEEQKASGFHITIYGNEDDIDVSILKADVADMSLVSYGGGVYGEKKDQVLRNADIFILTSRFEGMPMGVLEALTYGVPCILTPGTNLSREILAGGAGWETGMSANLIAETIIKASYDLKSDAFKYKNAAYLLSKYFDWEIVAQKSIELMKKMA